jgi:hypothetical protein
MMTLNARALTSCCELSIDYNYKPIGITESQADLIEVQVVLLPPLLYRLYHTFILDRPKTTCADDSQDLRMAAASMRCSTDSLPAMTIWKTPSTLPRSGSSY